MKWSTQALPVVNVPQGIIILTVATSLYAWHQEGVVHKLIMNPFLIDVKRQYYRFLTSGFIHKDWSHLLWNMIAFYFFGESVSNIFDALFGAAGPFYFIALYLLGIIVSDLPTYFKYRHNPGYSALGASGGVSSVIFASIIFQPLQDICIYFIICLPGFILGTLYLIYSYFQGKRQAGNINHDAHLYGALFGLVFCVIMYPASVVIFLEQLVQWRLPF